MSLLLSDRNREAQRRIKHKLADADMNFAPCPPPATANFNPTSTLSAASLGCNWKTCFGRQIQAETGRYLLPFLLPDFICNAITSTS